MYSAFISLSKCLRKMCQFTKISITILNVLYVYVTELCPAQKSFLKSCYIKRNVDCNHTFPTELTPNGIPSGLESIGKV